MLYILIFSDLYFKTVCYKTFIKASELCGFFGTPVTLEGHENW